MRGKIGENPAEKNTDAGKPALLRFSIGLAAKKGKSPRLNAETTQRGKKGKVETQGGGTAGKRTSRV